MLGVSGVLILGDPSRLARSTEYQRLLEKLLNYSINAKENRGCVAILRIENLQLLSILGGDVRLSYRHVVPNDRPTKDSGHRLPST